MLSLFFFFQAGDGIRDGHVTGVQTCALPICLPSRAVVQVNRAVAEALLALEARAPIARLPRQRSLASAHDDRREEEEDLVDQLCLHRLARELRAAWLLEWLDVDFQDPTPAHALAPPEPCAPSGLLWTAGSPRPS